MVLFRAVDIVATCMACFTVGSLPAEEEGPNYSTTTPRCHVILRRDCWLAGCGQPQPWHDYLCAAPDRLPDCKLARTATFTLLLPVPITFITRCYICCPHLFGAVAVVIYTRVITVVGLVGCTVRLPLRLPCCYGYCRSWLVVAVYRLPLYLVTLL